MGRNISVNEGKYRLFEQRFFVMCETFGCNEKATHSLGNPDGPPNLFVHICDECLESLRYDTNFNKNVLHIVDDNTTKPQLMEIAKIYGIKAHNAHTKQQIIDALKEYAKTTQETEEAGGGLDGDDNEIIPDNEKE